MRVHRAKRDLNKKQALYRCVYLPEAMEPRTFLSVSVPTAWAALPANYRPIGSPLAVPAVPNATAPSGVITPAQMEGSYGVTGITFAGSIAGNGAGQTIAIVDAYDDPNAASDLAAFDLNYGLPNPPVFRKLNDQGRTAPLPGTDPAGQNSPSGTWEEEESLDIEWAHVMAPQANIYLIEATDPSDLFNAEVAAAALPTVSVVSNSWGNSEGALDDSAFTTPAGHQGVTFLASAGDSGAFESGTSTIIPNYPASSPNVISVGGTNLQPDGTAYGSESAWGDGNQSGFDGGGGGGISLAEPQPTFQTILVSNFSTTLRTYPDVALDADPDSGVPIYDSWDFGTTTPWCDGPTGGTSLACPMFAGIIAIADQGRAINGLNTLDGPSQTVPLIYSLPTADFHDVTTGSNGYAAGLGYDLATGRGSPVGNLVIADLSSNFIGSYVFNDVNADGIQQPGETGVAGAVVSLDNSSGVPVATTTSDSQGFFEFSGVAVGIGDFLHITPPAGYQISKQVTTGTAGQENLASPFTGNTPSFDVTPGSVLYTENVGVYTQTITITPLVSVIRPHSGLAPMVFTVTLNPTPFSVVAVAYATADGTATVANHDYLAASGTLVFPIGVGQETITVDAVGNTIIENDVDYSVVLTIPPGYVVAPGGTGVGTGLIQNNNFPVATISGPPPQTRSATLDLTYAFTVNLSAPAPFVVNVDYSTEDYSAVAGIDYTTATGTVTFPAGSTSQVLYVLALPGTNPQEDKSFLVQITQADPLTATIGTPSQASATILTNSPPAISANNGSVTEGLVGTVFLPFTVDVAPSLTGPVTVQYTTADGTAKAGVDYIPQSGTLNFTPGRIQNTVYVPVPQQFIKAQTKTLTLTISNASGSILIVNPIATGTINYLNLATIPFAAAVPATPGHPAIHAVNAVYTDALGQRVTVSMKGVGSGEVVFLGNSSVSTNAYQIVLDGSTNANTSVNITVARNGQTSVTDFIAQAPLGTINAKALNVVSSFSAESSVNTINLGYLEGSTLSIGGTNTGPTAALNFGRVVNSTISSTIPIRSLTSGAYINTTTSTLPISAPTVGSVKVRGDFDGTIETATLQSLTVTGDIHGGVIASGSIGIVTAMDAVDATFFAGIADGTTGLPTLVTQFPDTAASIASIRIRKVFASSVISAWNVNNIQIGKVVTSPGTPTFGFSAGHVGTIRTVAGASGQIVNLTDPSTGLSVDNFSIVLV